MKTIYFAGGCFWGIQHFFKSVDGVVKTSVGYANGHTPNPTYREVCGDGTGHAETVEVVFDENVVSLKTLLNLFFDAVDPLSINHQGVDFGTQYRTGIYFVDKLDLPVVQTEMERLNEKLGKKSAIEVQPLKCYFLAEAYHQDYFDKNPRHQ